MQTSSQITRFLSTPHTIPALAPPRDSCIECDILAGTPICNATHAPTHSQMTATELAERFYLPRLFDAGGKRSATLTHDPGNFHRNARFVIQRCHHRSPLPPGYPFTPLHRPVGPSIGQRIYRSSVIGIGGYRVPRSARNGARRFRRRILQSTGGAQLLLSYWPWK